MGVNMGIRKLIHLLRYGISCSGKEWDARVKFIKKLRDSGFSIKTVPNPCRIKAYKGNEEYGADIITWSGEQLEICPFGSAIEYRHGPLPPEGAPIVDIPYQGRYGVFVSGKNSELFRQLCK